MCFLLMFLFHIYRTLRLKPTYNLNYVCNIKIFRKYSTKYREVIYTTFYSFAERYCTLKVVSAWATLFYICIELKPQETLRFQVCTLKYVLPAISYVMFICRNVFNTTIVFTLTVNRLTCFQRFMLLQSLKMVNFSLLYTICSCLY